MTKFACSTSSGGLAAGSRDRVRVNESHPTNDDVSSFAHETDMDQKITPPEHDYGHEANTVATNTEDVDHSDEHQEREVHANMTGLETKEGEDDDMKMEIDEISQDGSKEIDSDMLSVESFNFDESDDEMEPMQDDSDEKSSIHCLSRRFDADLVVQSIQRGETTLDQVEGRDCVLIVGKTGTGKSTLIQALAGKSIKEVKHSCSFTNGRETEVTMKDVYDAVDPLSGFEIGHEKKSKTATIGCFDPNSVSDGSFLRNKKLMFVDSPGFEDTGGLEGDVATSVLLSQVAGRCRSLAFVIMISYVSLLEDRGGSMRSVLRLIRSFTRNFEEDKQRFMFLFTHSNEIKGVPDDIDGAKKSLYDEIIRTFEGTNDEEIKSVLDHIRKCLKKGWPFVNVFLPLQTNGRFIQQSIEKCLKPTSDPHIAKNCGLTTTSRITLAAELQHRLQVLRCDLSADKPPLEAICTSLKLFQYFEKYVNVEDVRHIMLDVDALLQKFIEKQSSIVRQVIERGTGANESFGPAHISSLKKALSNLQILQSKILHVNACQALQNEANDRLQVFAGSLKIEYGQSFRGIQFNLSKLELWSRNFPEHTPLYEGSKSHLLALIDETVSKVASTDIDDILLHLHSKEKETRQLFRSIGVIKSIEDEKDGLRSHMIFFEDKCSNCKEASIGKIVKKLEYWEANMKSALSDPNVDLKKIEDMATVSNAIYCLRNWLEEHPFCEDLNKLVNGFGQYIANEVPEYFQTFASELDYMAPESLKRIVNATKRASELFGAIGGGLYRSVTAIHSNLVGRIKQNVIKQVGQLDEITTQIDAQGFKNGRQNMRSLLEFNAVCWFDFFLPDDERFVENHFIAFKGKHDDRISFVLAGVQKALRQIKEGNFLSGNLATTLKPMLLELTQISLFLEGFDSCSVDSEIEPKTKKQLLDIVTSSNKEYATCVNEWKREILRDGGNVEKTEIFNEKVDHVIRKVKYLVGLDPQCDAILCALQARVLNVLEEVSASIKRTMKVSGNYEKKLLLLQNMYSVQKYPRIAENLPTIEELQISVRDSIAAEAKVIEDLVSQTSEWEVIDSLLTQFEKAAMLDCFVNNEVNSRLSPLRKLREQKQEEVDSLLDQMICEEDFIGIRDFLDPFAKSKDQIKVQKFNNWLRKISCSLSDIVGSLSRNIEGDMTASLCDEVARGLQKLELAQTQLRRHLSSLPGGLNLKKEVANMKKELQRKFNILLTQLASAIEERDFENMGIKYQSIDIYMNSSVNKYLKKMQKKKWTDQLQRGYNSTKTGISRAMSKYTKSKFKENEIFFHMLHTLKNACLCNSPPLHDLQQLYADTSKSLRNELNEVVIILRESLSETGCYDDVIDIMSSLDNHMNSFLKDHVDKKELSFVSSEILKEWREEKCVIDRDMEFDKCAPEHMIPKWKSMLDKLAPSNLSVLRFARMWSLGTTYNKKKREINNLMIDRSKKGDKALKDADFVLLHECIVVLDLIETHLSAHISGAKDHSNKLRQLATNRFVSLCEQSQKILQSKKRTRLEAIFPDYRGYILQLPFIAEMKECQKSFALINQLVHEALDGDIKLIHELFEESAYDKLNKEIIRARRFGLFVADNFTLLMEELSRCGHVKTKDKWLQKIGDVCLEHFSSGRSLSNLKDCAILGIAPSATKNEVNKAYKKLAKKYHPDKSRTSDTSAMFRAVNEAKDKLLDAISSRTKTELPFGEFVKGIGSNLRQKVRTFLDEQRYDRVESILFALKDLNRLKNLVSPELEYDYIINDIHNLVGSNVKKVQTTVKSSWTSKDYKTLNDSITDLKMMEERFKSYENIFPSSWNEGIVQLVEDKILDLGRRARGYLASKKSAKENVDNFRRCFLNMGQVLVELPLFKDFTKAEMSSVLERCLEFEGGYSFLFEFGLGLSKGNGDEEDNNVAQMLLSEFSHFKEVMTMVWNEETSQKPAEDTVYGIKGIVRRKGKESDIPLDRDALLKSFHEFEAEYKALLAEYLVPEADLNRLVSKTNRICERMRPLELNSGWNQEVKNNIPSILASVFTAFTIQKSGASYCRLESTSGANCEKLLMKPHNIQVLTLLSLFGCGSSSSTSLKSQLMQIRTGEGKSMILGAAAIVLALLGFRVRCVCYSDYLSARDFSLFRDIFDLFSVTEFVKYSKITTLSEDATVAKGDIRSLTKAMFRGELQNCKSCEKNGQAAHPVRSILKGNGNSASGSETVQSSKRRKSSRLEDKEDGGPVTVENDGESTAGQGIKSRKRRKLERNENEPETRQGCMKNDARKEILLVDEVDVFFGSNFYGQTYNQVTEFREPEIVEILNHIWIANKRSTRRQRLADIQALTPYKQLLAKMPDFKFLIDAEISLMIDQVRKFDEEPYILDHNRIGYKVMDSISFEATYGYRTVFAYIHEAEENNLKDKKATLQRALTMQISCGRFSYAAIAPDCILGVSGTLSALGNFEYDILSNYGVETFMYVPSVYGASNFQFDKAGSGTRIDSTMSDYFHSITDRIKDLTKQNRAVIVFFKSNKRLKEFTDSSFYRKLGRNKKLLTENLNRSDKEFVISKAATAKQITISTAVFGRGTDFFCKDETVQKNGGVHVIQTFLSEELSEEIQIQGRTARQGKKGSYELFLLASDLEEKFSIHNEMKNTTPKREWYSKLCAAREQLRREQNAGIEENLTKATEMDRATHEYFDSLLSRQTKKAAKKFKEIYKLFKTGEMPSSLDLDIGFLVDITGSMAPYAPSLVKTVDAMLRGDNSITKKLQLKFPEITFSLRVGILGFRDIDDTSQFLESNFDGKSHFTDDVDSAILILKSITSSPSGGGDIAEDHLGAIDMCANWSFEEDWSSPIKFMLLLTDAPTHGMVPKGSKGVSNVDSYSVRHPSGITVESTIETLMKNELDLFFCSFNPSATSLTESTLSDLFMKHPQNADQREIISIPMVTPNNDKIVPVESARRAEVLGGYGKHIIFVLDMSGSMAHDWSGVVAAYNQYIDRRKQSQSDSDYISVVQFDSGALTSVELTPITITPSNLTFRGGGTCFYPAAVQAFELASKTPPTHSLTIVFMSDGGSNDADAAAGKFSELNRNVRQSSDSDIELHVIAFGGGASTQQLQKITGSSRRGKLHTSADTAELSNIFVEIAGDSNVAQVLEAEIGKRISDAVSDRLSLEYIA